MPTLTLQITPNQLTLGLLDEPQLCYALLTIDAQGAGDRRPVNWALVADASRSMRIPIVDEAQFRALLRDGGAQETLVDGVPVWQLTAPVPADIRAAAPSALDFVARALHSVVERLDGHDHFALVAYAEEAVLLNRSTSGADRVELVRGISRLKSLNLGEQTDMAQGIQLALNELRRGRAARNGPARAERLLLLTDGFTQRPDECLRLAGAAAGEGVAISTVGLGGEFQEDVLTGLADRSGGRAVFLRKPDDIPRAVAAELGAARAVAARGVALRADLADGVALRRLTQIRPALRTLADDRRPTTDDRPGTDDRSVEIRLGDLEANMPITLLLELLAPPRPAGPALLGRVAVAGDDAPAATAELRVDYRGQASPPSREVLDAAARANAARLQRRALETTARGDAPEAARLLRAAAARLDDLGERALAEIARGQAATLEQGGPASPLATKELAYATRRLGEFNG
ncbi:MAG TPA: VWA domain-containing protein [Roseiflexaceae bacterium]